MPNTISPCSIFKIWRPLNPKISNVPGFKVKLLAHCCHTSDYIIDMHTEHSMDFSTFSKNKCTWMESTTFESVVAMIDFLSLSHPFFGAFTNMWRSCSRPGCQGNQRKYAGYLSATSTKLKMSGSRNSKVTRERMRKEMK